MAAMTIKFLTQPRVYDKILDSRLRGNDRPAEMFGTEVFLIGLLFPLCP